MSKNFFTEIPLHQNNLEVMKVRGLLPKDFHQISEKCYKSIEINASRIDGFHAVLSNVSGKVAIGSRFSEAKHVKKQLQGLPIEKNCFYTTFNFDTGSYIREILNRISNSSFLMCVINFPEMFYKICETFDVSQILDDRRLIIFITPNREFMKSHIDAVTSQVMMACSKTHHLKRTGGYHPIGFNDHEWEKCLSESLHQSGKFALMNINTHRVTIKHYLENSYIGIQCQDWGHVRQKTKKKPMVIIGVGPSLELEIEKIKRIQDQVYIGVVDNGLRALLSRGIEPDFVFQVDFHERTLDFYRGLDIPKKSILVFLLGVYPGVLPFWKGPKLSFLTDQIKPLVGEFMRNDVPQFVGSNVGILAIQFAINMGSDPIYLVGFDLCSPMANYFHPDVVQLQNAYPMITRFWSVERMDYDYNKRFNETIEVTGHDGKPVWTAMSIQMGKTAIERLLSTNGGRNIYSSSFHGNPINGAPYKDFLDLVKEVEGFAQKGGLKPNQKMVKNEDLRVHCDKKQKELLIYFNHLKKLRKKAEKVCKAEEQKISIKKIRSLYRDVGLFIDSLHSEDVAWVEVAILELNRKLNYLYANEELKKLDIEDKYDRLKSWVELFLSNAPQYLEMQPFLVKYFDQLRELAKPE